MSDITALGFKLSTEKSEQFKRALEQNGLNQTKFFRACVDKFLSENSEEFLRVLGFEKKFYWSK